jgi:hypothetical protein
VPRDDALSTEVRPPCASLRLGRHTGHARLCHRPHAPRHKPALRARRSGSCPHPLGTYADSFMTPADTCRAAVKPTPKTPQTLHCHSPLRPSIPSPRAISGGAPPDGRRSSRVDSPDRWFILPMLLLSKVVLSEQIRQISWVNMQHGCRLPLDPVSTRERFKKDLFFRQVQFFP